MLEGTKARLPKVNKKDHGKKVEIQLGFGFSGREEQILSDRDMDF